MCGNIGTRAIASRLGVRIGPRIVRAAQTIIQAEIQSTPLRRALLLSQSLVALVQSRLSQQAALEALGITILDFSVTAITPTPETARALEAEARESLLKEADDAIYARRKSSVEQERTIKEAELETDLSVQKKEQQIEESRLENERALLREQAAMAQERLAAEIGEEQQRQTLVSLSADNQRVQSDARESKTRPAQRC